MKTKILLSFITLLAFMLILISCEAENPGEPKENVAPETYISEASPGNTTSISFYGTDKDGFVDMFSYKWDTDATWTNTESNTVTFSNVFANQTEVKVFQVKGIDDAGMEDATPAEIALTATNALPNTEITGGPEFGKEAGEDVTFTFSGEDVESDGSIIAFEYTMDDLHNWQETDVDNPQATFLGLATGAHVFYVRAKDNLEGVDPTPAQVAFVVVGGKYAPTLQNLSPVNDGGGWFAGVALPFSWTSVVADYYGQLAEAPYSYAVDDATGFNDSAVEPLASGWNSNTSYDYDPSPGAHTFYLKVRDTAGGVDRFSISFTAATPTFDQGILVVCGVGASVYGSQIIDKINAGAYWGTLNVSFWDIFGSMSAPQSEFTLPATVTHYEGGGSGGVPPTVFAKYSTVVWLGNIYQGDDAVYAASPILPYLNAGGNVIFASRYAADYMGDGVTAWANIGWREDGAVIEEYEPVFPGLVSMEPFLRSMSATAVFSSYPFDSGGSTSDADVSNWGGVRSFSKDAYTTLLFAHRTSAVAGSFSFVRGLGVWSHPNFAFSSLTAGDEFPTPGTSEAQGNFIYIAGRHYGFDVANCTANFEFMLRNMCGEQ